MVEGGLTLRLKYYFTDIGLRNARLNFRQQEPTHIMENVVYNELLIRGYNVDVGIVDICDKDRDGKRVHKQLEVDFVVNQGSQRYYIQVAYDMTSEEKQVQEFRSFRNISDSFKKIVIVNGTTKPWRNEEGGVVKKDEKTTDNNAHRFVAIHLAGCKCLWRTMGAGSHKSG